MCLQCIVPSLCSYVAPHHDLGWGSTYVYDNNIHPRHHGHGGYGHGGYGHGGYGHGGYGHGGYGHGGYGHGGYGHGGGHHG